MAKWFLRKASFNMYVTLGQGQEMTLNFNTTYLHYLNQFQAAIVSEKSTVFTFSYR